MIVEHAKVPIYPTLLFVVVERSIGKDRQSLPATQRCGNSFVVATFIRPAEQSQDLVTAERHFPCRKIIQATELDAGQQDVVIFGCG